MNDLFLRSLREQIAQPKLIVTNESIHMTERKVHNYRLIFFRT